MTHLEPYTLAVQRQRLAKRHWRVVVNGNTVAVIRGIGAKHRAKAIARSFEAVASETPPVASHLVALTPFQAQRLIAG